MLVLTVCNFLLLVYLLKKFAWGPIIGALEKRETQIANDRKTAASAREQAEALKQELDTRLAQISDEAAKKMAAIVKTGEAQKEALIAQAKEQAAQLVDQAKVQIEAEKNRALSEVRGEIANLSLLAASRVIGRQVQDSTADQIVAQVLAQVEKK